MVSDAAYVLFYKLRGFEEVLKSSPATGEAAEALFDFSLCRKAPAVKNPAAYIHQAEGITVKPLE